MNIISEVLSACVSSAKAEPLKLDEGKHGMYRPRGQFHVMLLMPFGSGKSSGLIGVKGKEVYNMGKANLPGIVGTIKKDGYYNPGAAELGAGKVWLHDECHNMTESGREAMLKLLEGEVASRNLGFKLRNKIKKNKKYFKLYANDGHMNVQSSFSCVSSGLFAHRKRMNDFAFISRYFPLKIRLTLREAFEASRGKKIFDVKPDYYTETPVFEDYLKFVDAYENIVLLLKDSNRKLYDFLSENYGYIRRNIVDFSRFFAWVSRGRGSVDDWEKYLGYIPVSLYNYATSTLTLTEFEILDEFQRQETGKEIASKVSVSENYVSDTLKKLRGLGLVG